jgi:hypothetical protein
MRRKKREPEFAESGLRRHNLCLITLVCHKMALSCSGDFAESLMRQISFAYRLFSFAYFATATISTIWLLLQSEWTVISAGIAVIFVAYLSLSIAAAFFLLYPTDRPSSSPDFQLSLRQQQGLHLSALMLPLPILTFFGFYWITFLTLDSSTASCQRAALCIGIGESLLGSSCAEELSSQFAWQAGQRAESAELATQYLAAEKMYRMQSQYQRLAGRTKGPAAHAGIVAAAAMCDRLGRSHEADVLYALAENSTSCRYKNKDRNLSVIYGPHLLKLLRDVPDSKLPASWYLTATVLELRKSTAAKAALVVCPFDFIVEHDCSHRAFTPKLAELQDAEKLWKQRQTAGTSSPGSPFVPVQSDFRKFSTTALKRYLRKIEPRTASENLAFFDEFQECSSYDMDPKLLPNKRSCSIGFPYTARHLAARHVWRISENDYVAMKMLVHEAPGPQLMCLDDSSSLKVTY